ncbi:ProQ/FinO family protein [Agrobacterium vitis]|uniref:ProQ/FinO family protein n=1 Tax=Agrobacterium vitis TaxID=373 RepID=UPI003B5227E6
MLPFRIGINTDIEKRLRLDAALSDLRKALRRNTHSAAYLYATAQPDALRHDIVGEPCGNVSEEDRLHARQSFLLVQERRKQRRQQCQSENSAQN